MKLGEPEYGLRESRRAANLAKMPFSGGSGEKHRVKFKRNDQTISCVKKLIKLHNATYSYNIWFLHVNATELLCPV